MRYLFVLFFFFLAGCSFTPLVKETKLIIIKSPKIRYNDIGYIQHDNKDVIVELYNAGISLAHIEIGRMVCLKDKGCIPKKRFNKEFFYHAYEDDFLKKILLGEPLFQGKNLQKFSDGFMQTFYTDKYAITYKVTQKEIFFKDKKNHIIIKIKDI